MDDFEEKQEKSRVFELGSVTRPVVLICNALGMPTRLMMPMIYQLSKNFRVITWEDRFHFDESVDISSFERPLFTRHLMDMFEILRDRRIKRLAVIGWCNGSRAALELAGGQEFDVWGAVLISGNFRPRMGGDTPYERSVRQLIKQVRERPGTARHFVKMFASQYLEPLSHENCNILTSVLSKAEALSQAQHPFRSERKLVIYSNVIGEIADTETKLVKKSGKVPTLVAIGSRDEHVSVEGSRELAGLFALGEYLEIPDGDHFSISTDAVFLQQVSAWLVDKAF